MNAVAEPLSFARTAIEGAVHIPLELLRPSPTNPRQHFDEAKLADLARSIRTHTLMQPILARPVAGAKAGEALYEIVAGERRWRASKLADTGTIMAIVRDLTDFDVLELQLIENLQRDDLHPLEEATGYQRLLRKPDGLQGYANADELAERIGKSRSYVFQRLKLLDLQGPGRKAFLDGSINFSVALLIARLHKADQQAQATQAIVQGWGGNAMSFRDASEYIQREFMLALDRAVFKITDAELLPAAGSCRDCGKRTGANPDLFEDVKKADTCTDATCYHAKEDAHRAQQKAAAEASGMEVISGKDAKKFKRQQHGALKGVLKLDEVHHQLGTKTLRQLLGKDLPEIFMFEDPHTQVIFEVVYEKDALARLKAAGKIKAASMPGSSPGKNAAEAKAKAETAWRQAVATQCVEAALGNAGADTAYRSSLLTDVAIVLWARLSGDDEKRVEKLLAWEHIGSDYASKGNELRKLNRIRALSDAQLCQFFTAAAVAGQVYVNQYNASLHKPVRLLDIAARLGVDADAVRAEIRNAGLTRVPGKKSKAPGAKKVPAPAGGINAGTDQTLNAYQRNVKRIRDATAAGATEVTPETALAGALKAAKPGRKGRSGAATPAPTISAEAANPFRLDSAK